MMPAGTCNIGYWHIYLVNGNPWGVDDLHAFIPAHIRSATAYAASRGASQHTSLNKDRLRLHSAYMAAYLLFITDADAEASTLLRRSRDAGYDRVTVPYDEDFVDAWRLGASQPGIDVDMMQKLLEVRHVALHRRACRAPGPRCGSSGSSFAAAMRHAADCTVNHTEAIGYVQVAHYLDADLEPWAAALAAALFTDAAFPPAAAQSSHQIEGNEAQAEAAPASSNFALRQAVWRRLDALAGLDGAADAVLRSWRRPLLEQLPLTPAEWQPVVIGSHAVSGVLQLRLPTATTCRGAMHAVHDVHSLSLDFSVPRHDQVPPATEEISLTLHAVATMPALRSVDLDLSHRRCPRIVEELSPALGNLPQLASLRLNDNGIGAAGAAALAPLLGALTALTSLCLGENRFGDDSAEALALALTRLSRLAALDLSHVCTDATAFLEPLGALTALTALYLSHNILGRVAAGALVRALTRLSRLAHLRLEDISMDATPGAAALAEHRSALTTLTALNLSGNYLGGDGVRSLAPALRRLPRLAAFVLEDNDMGATGTAALAEHLSALTTLTELGLTGSMITRKVTGGSTARLRGCRRPSVASRAWPISAWAATPTSPLKPPRWRPRSVASPR